MKFGILDELELQYYVDKEYEKCLVRFSYQKSLAQWKKSNHDYYQKLGLKSESSPTV